MFKWIKKIFDRSSVVAVVRLDGVIGSAGQFGGGGLTDSGLKPVLEKAFEMSRLKSVALVINSPGGSPTQSSLIAARIKNLSVETEIPVIAFCEDVAASGGYWLACAGDEIFADENSIIGSIGVISAGFGFHEFISRQGIERRVYTSGQEKSMLDPFKPEEKSEVLKLKKIQKAIHENFKNYVNDRRGQKVVDKPIFTGEVWDAKSALELGLIDGIGHLEPILKDKFGEKTVFRSVNRKKGFVARLTKSFVNDLIGAVLNKLYFSRYNT